jgi:pantothenate kinase-related protein Tda10
VPLPASEERTALIATVAEMVAAPGPGALRIAVDGLTGSGKTSFGHELAAALCALGRATMRASLDDFRYPWRHARERGESWRWRDSSGHLLEVDKPPCWHDSMRRARTMTGAAPGHSRA